MEFILNECDVEGEDDDDFACFDSSSPLSKLVSQLEEDSQSPPAKKIKEITDSMEKLGKTSTWTTYLDGLRAEPQTPGSSPVRRELFQDEPDSGIETVPNTEGFRQGSELHYECSEELAAHCSNLVDDVDLSIIEQEDDSQRNALKELVKPGDLKRAFYHFSCGEPPFASFNDLHREMKSEKTMQSTWAIFCEKPFVQKQRSHLPVEALLTVDCNKIRTKTTTTYVYYLLQYTTKQRSVSGLKSLLKQAGVNNALMGAPKMKTPGYVSWAQTNTAPLNLDDDVQFLTLADLAEDKSQFEFQQLQDFCTENKPETLEQLICLYNKAGDEGDNNAVLWRGMTTCYAHAKTAFLMYKSKEDGELQLMSLADYFRNRLDKETTGSDVKVRQILLYQGINEYCFLTALRKWFAGKVKHNCIVLQGPGSTGKSMFAEALTHVLKGAFLKVHPQDMFWQSPLVGKKMGLIDDLTMEGWDHLDVHCRRALDGGTVCVNKKYHQPTQLKFPPIFITTNVVLEGERWDFILNRTHWFFFPRKLHADVVVTAEDILCWLQKNKEALDLD